MKNLFTILWTDRSTVIRKIGRIPFYLNYGREPVLPIELDMSTWRILPWNDVFDTAGFLAFRARQIQQRDENLKKIIFYL